MLLTGIFFTDIILIMLRRGMHAINRHKQLTDMELSRIYCTCSIYIAMTHALPMVYQKY